MPALPTFTMPYAKVEAALARMHNIAPEDVPAFRSRLGSLQRGGLLGPKNRLGKGQKLQYGPDHFHRLVLAIELTQGGIGPAVIQQLVSEQWDKLRQIFALAERTLIYPAPSNANDIMLVLPIDLMFNWIGFNPVQRDELPQYIELVFGDNSAPARFLLVNLSAQLRKFHEALAHYNLQSDQVVEAALAPRAKAPKRQRVKPNKAAKK